MRLSTRLALAAAAFLVVLALPALGTAGATGAASDLGLGRELAQGSLLAFALALAGGVLTSLTPCVYPLIPITVSIFGARQARSRGQAAALSGLYVLGIAGTYSALGATAALSGQVFGTALQRPWVIVLVAAVFLALAASMFGAFELRLPSALQARLNAVGGAGYLGAFLMGLVAGLIAAPCTGPVLAAALTYVATRGSVVLGVSIMFVYALGIGLPFFLLGAFSVSLPKGGAWMEAVKRVFGVALLAMALVYLRDLFPALAPLFSPARAAAWAAGAAAAAGVLLGALQAGEGPRAARALGLLGAALVALAAVYAVGVGQARAHRAGEGVAWLVNQEPAALARARAEERPVVIDFWGDWCAACKELDRTAWSDPRVQAEAARFVALKMDNSAARMADPAAAAAVEAVFEKYGVVGQPTVIFIDARGRELPAAARVTGVVDAGEMLRRLQAVDRACTAAVACLTRW